MNTTINITARRMFMAWLLAMASLAASAQAFDGDSDHRFNLGYQNIGGGHGVAMGYDYGISDDISLGSRLMYINKSFTNPGGGKENAGRVDVALSVDYHFMEALKLPDNFDILAGMGIGFYGGDLHAMTRYHFSETVGVYAGVSHGLFHIFKEPDDEPHFMSKKLGFSIGLTFSFW